MPRNTGDNVFYPRVYSRLHGDYTDEPEATSNAEDLQLPDEIDVRRSFTLAHVPDSDKFNRYIGR